MKKWLEMSEGELEKDKRGGIKGKLLKHSEAERRRIIKIRKRLKQETCVYVSSKLIKAEYQNIYGRELSEWFINKTIKEIRAPGDMKKKEPVHDRFVEYSSERLKKFGKVIMSIDFIGTKHLKGTGIPVLFLACKYLYPANLGIISQVENRTWEEVIRVLQYVWRLYAKPDLLRMSFNPAFGGNLSPRRCLGKLPIFLLNMGVIPFYSSAPDLYPNMDLHKFSNVFSSQFGRLLNFQKGNNKELRVKNFYLEYNKRSEQKLEKLLPKLSLPGKVSGSIDLANKHIDHFRVNKIFFFRKVKSEWAEGGTRKIGATRILATDIMLDQELSDCCVLCRLDLKKKNSSSTMRVRPENQG